MSRYIDADMFDDTVQKLNEQGWHITNIDYKRMDRVLFEMPTADVVEKEKWDRLLENSIILTEAVQKYRLADAVEVKRGKWNHPYHYGLALPEHQCSECGYLEYADSESNFCPNCGAKMQGAEEK